MLLETSAAPNPGGSRPRSGKNVSSRSNQRPLSFGFRDRSNAFQAYPVSVTSRRFGGSVRDLNPRRPECKSGALSTELTEIDVISSETMFGTDGTDPFQAFRPPLDRRHQRTSHQVEGGESRVEDQKRVTCGDCFLWLSTLNPTSSTNKRRRRESNPRDAVLQAAATPCDISVEKVESREFRVESQKKQRSAVFQLSTLNHQPSTNMSLPGVEPGLQPSRSRVLSVTPQGRNG